MAHVRYAIAIGAFENVENRLVRYPYFLAVFHRSKGGTPERASKGQEDPLSLVQTTDTTFPVSRR